MSSGFAPIRRGLLDHLRTMSSNATKLYLFLHLTARWTGRKRGTIETRYTGIAAALGWPLLRVKRTVAELQPRYVEILQAGNQHRPTVIRILKYDGAGITRETSRSGAGIASDTGTRELVSKTARYHVENDTSTSQIPNKHAASRASKNVLEVKNKKYPPSFEKQSIPRLEVQDWAT